ncbi:GNAT family N-acetyltransferase [Haloechinothrix sp. YIM 98757]|uniref:GNAT family N-acetyltransferase n=1 Tax=Haloechinothrix aidingensis TaxID=2752311 RepID=A0A838AD96_9PSEU|nr:GNAT family N-acetyltransferase [Haloechinothrix aidingensis]
MEHIATAEIAGTLDTHTRQDHLARDQANIAYGLYPQWRGRGLATRAVLLACHYLSTRTATRQAVLRIHPHNTASIALAHRAGLSYTHRVHADDGPLYWYIRALGEPPTGLRPTGSRRPDADGLHLWWCGRG